MRSAERPITLRLRSLDDEDDDEDDDDNDEDDDESDDDESAGSTIGLMSSFDVDHWSVDDDELSAATYCLIGLSSSGTGLSLSSTVIWP